MYWPHDKLVFRVWSAVTISMTMGDHTTAARPDSIVFSAVSCGRSNLFGETLQDRDQCKTWSTELNKLLVVDVTFCQPGTSTSWLTQDCWASSANDNSLGMGKHCCDLVASWEYKSAMNQRFGKNTPTHKHGIEISHKIHQRCVGWDSKLFH